jgi:aspartyl aminopeptidase
MSDKPNTDLGERFPRTAEQAADLRTRGEAAARDLCAFLDRSPTPFHAAREAAARLAAAGFREISERDAWDLAPGKGHYLLRGGSTLIAFVTGTEPPADGGFRMIGAHTDSPNLRVKPNADLSRNGFQQVGVEVYGGVLLSTWLDRDLSIAGRVLCRNAGAEGGVEARLVDLARPVARVPNVAIHLNRGVNKDGLVLNEQRHMVPVVGLGKEAVLRATIARALEIEEGAVLGYDLALYDTEKAAIGGLGGEFVFSARLDNLGSCHAAVAALTAAAATPSPATRLIALYDHEECGSRSAVGAAGSVLRDTVARIVEARSGQPQALGRAMSRSLLVSADMAHGIHPNYADQHEPSHAPLLNRGLVIKSTDGTTAAAFELCCEQAGFTPQRFVVRSDLPCGSTIGPITAAQLGVATVDVGSPMLSMHSCREMCGALDVHLAIEAFKAALG